MIRERDELFVGRQRETARIRAELAAGRNLVLTGPVGIGCTALLRHVAEELRDRYRFVFVDGPLTPARICRRLADELCTPRVDGSWKQAKHRLATASFADPRQPVAVLDGLVKATPPVLNVIEWLRNVERFRVVVIVESGPSPRDLNSVRARLLAAPPLRLERLGVSAAREYFEAYATRAGFAWTEQHLRSLTSVTHGYPLAMAEAARHERGRALREGERG